MRAVAIFALAASLALVAAAMWSTGRYQLVVVTHPKSSIPSKYSIDTHTGEVCQVGAPAHGGYDCWEKR
jgi:hypothetical protein